MVFTGHFPLAAYSHNVSHCGVRQRPLWRPHFIGGPPSEQQRFMGRPAVSEGMSQHSLFSVIFLSSNLTWGWKMPVFFEKVVCSERFYLLTFRVNTLLHMNKSAMYKRISFIGNGCCLCAFLWEFVNDYQFHKKGGWFLDRNLLPSTSQTCSIGSYY